MARRENSDFLKRLFDEPAGGKSPKSRPGKRPRRPVPRADVLAVLEAAGERLEEGVVLDDGLLAAFLDGALAADEQVALEGLLARSADLRDQLAAAGAARAAVLGGKARMPEAFIEDFDAVPGPKAGKPSQAPRTSALPRWLASIAPGRRWAMAALPAILAVVVVAVIGPGVYGPEEAPAPETVAGGVLADKDVRSKLMAAMRRSKTGARKKSAPAGTRASGVLESRVGVVASVIVPLDDDLRAAIITMGLRQKRPLSVVGGRTRAKQEAAKPAAPKPPAKIAGERQRREAKAKPDSEKALRRSYSAAQRRVLRKPPAVFARPLEKAIGKNCPGGAAQVGASQGGAQKCCQRSRIAPKLLRRLLAGGPPLQKMTVLHLSSKICLLTLPEAAPGR